MANILPTAIQGIASLPISLPPLGCHDYQNDPEKLRRFLDSERFKKYDMKERQEFILKGIQCSEDLVLEAVLKPKI